MTAIEKFIQDFKLLNDMEKKEAMERLIILFHPMNVCALLRTIVNNDIDAICKPILRHVMKYVGKIE